MSFLPQLSGEFTVVADPELKYSQGENPMALARVRLVANSRKKVDGEWIDDKTLWMSGTAFGKVAENIAESVVKGSRVVVIGRLHTEEWEKDGNKRSATALIIDKFAIDLMFDPAKSYKRDAPQQGGNQSSDPWGPSDNDAPPF
jgi:single-strand DNA-binding protein